MKRRLTHAFAMSALLVATSAAAMADDKPDNAAQSDPIESFLRDDAPMVAPGASDSARGRPAAPRAARDNAPLLGVAVAPLPAQLADVLGLRRDAGVLIQQVLPDTAAALAGVQAGDLLVQFGAHDVTDAAQLAALVAAAPIGDEVMLTLLREGRKLELPATLKARDDMAVLPELPALLQRLAPDQPIALPAMGDGQLGLLDDDLNLATLGQRLDQMDKARRAP